MLDVYEKQKQLKEEVKSYIDLLNNTKDLPKQNELIYISKLILFQKEFFKKEDDEESYYSNFMIYNILMIMHSLSRDSKIFFYQLYRSYIENILRVMLNLKNNDDTGVNTLFNNFSNRYNDVKMKKFVFFLKGEYSKACDYVHSNIRADLDVQLFYSEILNSDEMNDDNIGKLILKVKQLLSQFVEFLIDVEVLKIYEVYYRRDSELKFLIGENLYKKFKKAITEID